MAKLHTKRHGRSKSRKPVLKEGMQSSSALTKEQIEKLIVDYTKQGIKPAMIGEKLKKEHGVPYIKQVTGKRMMQVLKENQLAGKLPPDLVDLMAKAVNLTKHLEVNKRDVHGAVRLERTKSKIWRLTKYYINKGALPENWRYNYQEAEILVRGKE